MISKKDQERTEKKRIEDLVNRHYNSKSGEGDSPFSQDRYEELMGLKNLKNKEKKN